MNRDQRLAGLEIREEEMVAGRRVLVWAISVAWLLGTTTLLLGQRMDDGCRFITVKGRIVSALGWPHGGTVFVLSGSRLDELYCARTDNLGEVSCKVRLPRTEREAVVVAISQGMVRNTLDEWLAWEAEMNGEFPPASRAGPHPGHVHLRCFRECGAQVNNLQDYIRTFGRNHSRAVMMGSDSVYVTGHLDSVAKSVSITEKEEVDVGGLRFPVAHAAMELTMHLKNANGQPFRRPAILGGFRGTLSGGKNGVYPHLALSQRGNVVRVIMTRAAARLLVNEPEEFLVLTSTGPVGDRSMRPLPFCVRLRGDALRKLEQGYRRIDFELTVPPSSDRLARELRSAPRVPQLWSFGEPTF